MIGELCDHIRNHVKPSERPDDRYLGLTHVAPGRLTAQQGDRATDVRSAKVRFRTGDVLYGKLAPYLDKAVLADTEGICTTELLVLRPKEGVSGRYLVCALHHPHFVQHAVSGTTGTTHPRTSWNHIKRFKLPTCSYEKQEQIASNVWKIESAITASLAVVQKGRRLTFSAVDALLDEASHGVSAVEVAPQRYPIVALGDLCIPTRSDLVSVAKEGDRTIEYVDVSSVCRQMLRVSSTSRYRLHDAPSRARKRIRTDDVIFATVRPKLMRIAFVPSTLNNQVCSTAFCVLRANRTLVEPRYIYYVVQRKQFVHAVGSMETGATYPAVTDRVILGQLVPVPPLSIQRKIVDTLDAIWNTVDVHQKKISILEKLRKRILLDMVAQGDNNDR